MPRLKGEVAAKPTEMFPLIDKRPIDKIYGVCYYENVKGSVENRPLIDIEKDV
ncbi:MAG: hypothetical protein IJB74_00135 [Clostridia bacterium]|nr:hypothetical protein [Clostridia bacterium]